MRNEQPLTPQQRAILTLAYRFRFISSRHVQQALGIKYISNVQPRLNKLVENGLIGRNYNGSQRLAGLPASYYLLPAGMKALKQFDPDVDKRVLHAIYGDKTAGDGFIRRCLAIGDINVELERIYGHKLEFFTQSECKEYEYFPDPLPGAYFTIAGGSDPLEFFLEICDEATPSFVYKNRFQQYIEYGEEGVWAKATGSEMPVILLVCVNDKLQHRLQRLANLELENFYGDELRLVATTKMKLDQLASTRTRK